MQFRISFTIMISTLILFFIGCGVDEFDESDSVLPKTELLGSITGKVLDENGNPVSGATVTTEPATSQIITEANGHYEIPKVANGNYTVWAKTSDREGMAPVSVKGGIAIADIRLTGEIVPSVTIIGGPEEATASQNVSFSWTGRNVTDYSYKLDNGDWSAWGKETSKEYKNLAPGGHTFSVKGRDGKGKESEVAARTFTIVEPPQTAIEITSPKSNEKVELLTTISGKVVGAKDLNALKAALGLKNETLKVALWVWDPNDPHGPWDQAPATIKNDLTWVEDRPAQFGRPGQDVGVKFNIRAQLAIHDGVNLIPIDEVEPVTISNVIRK